MIFQYKTMTEIFFQFDGKIKAPTTHGRLYINIIRLYIDIIRIQKWSLFFMIFHALYACTTIFSL